MSYRGEQSLGGRAACQAGFRGLVSEGGMCERQGQVTAMTRAKGTWVVQNSHLQR